MSLSKSRAVKLKMHIEIESNQRNFKLCTNGCMSINFFCHETTATIITSLMVMLQAFKMVAPVGHHPSSNDLHAEFHHNRKYSANARGRHLRVDFIC